MWKPYPDPFTASPRSGDDATEPEREIVVLGPGVILIRPPAPAAASPAAEADRHHEHRLERLVERMPPLLRDSTRWLRRPSSRWARVPAGGLLSILPFLGLWMLPLGLALLAEDVPPLWRARGRMLHWLARRRPHWFAGPQPAPFPS
jgi:hypothetical protein